MKEEFKEALRGWLAAHWQEDRGQCLGLLAGITLAIMILLIGFWRTAFIVLFTNPFCSVKASSTMASPAGSHRSGNSPA